MNKKKIFNDPVYGFVTIPSDLIFDIIDHPLFQRLRRIKQLGLTDLVYPGALHTRFHHALGAMHLMQAALDNLRSKGHEISAAEYEAMLIAILLHDIGHGPFSHALENTLLLETHHEHLSCMMMEYLNEEFDGALDLTLRIFKDQYERKFFHQLVSSQLDIDRLDYLNRDSFFTGVSEGTIGADRIIKMLDIRNDEIVVEEKGIYSIENFLSARRLMYWQVYLHKTTVSAEKMLIELIKRAQWLASSGEDVFATPNLALFLKDTYKGEDLRHNAAIFQAYGQLDDFDIWASIKMWIYHPDKVLRMLSNMLMERKLFKVKLSNEPIAPGEADLLREKIAQHFEISPEEAAYFVAYGSMSNSAYLAGGQIIHILTKKGEIKDIAKASDLPNIKAMSKIVRKNYLCWVKPLSLR